MTRRVRFTPRDRFRAGVVGLSLVGLLASAGGAAASEVPFGPAAIVGTPSLPAWVDAGDLDRDGDLDFASAGNFGIAWHGNVGGAGSSWTTHTVATDGIYRSVLQGDVDRDGDVDLLATSPSTDRILWYENTAGNGSAWTARTIATGIDGPRSAVLADVDGDGDPDVVSTATANVLHWHENAAGNGTTWVRRTIATAVYGASSAATADVDRDGDLDVMASSANDQTVAWYENVDGSGGTWATRTIANPSGAGTRLTAADFDGDGDVDAVTSVLGAGPIQLFENLDGHGGAWTARPIATPPSPVRSTTAADVDRDGDLDVMVPVGGSAQPGTAVWYDNVAGDGSVWTERTIGTAGAGSYQVLAADVDGDGDQDAASVSFYGEILWYRNQSIHEDACFVLQPDIAVGARNTLSLDVATADIDGDGDLDAVSVPREFTNLAWHENVGGGTAWATHLVVSTFMQSQTKVATGDLDGDGDVDLVASPDPLYTFRNTVGNGTIWTQEELSLFLTQSRLRLQTIDLDQDGDRDILVPDDSGHRVIWLENPGNGTGWVRRTIAASLPFPRDGVAADLDGDGDPDVVASADAGLSWFENLGGAGTWAAHTIAPIGSWLVVADIDGDGDTDLLVTSGTTLLWLENAAGNGTSWTTRTVGTANPPFGALWMDAGDLDGDGDVDGVSLEPGPDGLAWHENVTGDGSSWARRTLETFGTSFGTARLADLDGDGALDVLTGKGLGSAVGWMRNAAGQVRLSVADQVPPSVENGDVFSMLRVTVTHGGRAGESDLELARLGLRFQEDTPAGPLSSAEANALVEELRIYRDANGNGTFDPGTDTLIATVATLALTNGVQTIPFTDGDPNVRVAHGAPATFFVVAQLTANASEQGPNQFRVVHLATGASATLAEDASADTALATACPADFESGLVGRITPVELTGFSIE